MDLTEIKQRFQNTPKITIVAVITTLVLLISIIVASSARYCSRQEICPSEYMSHTIVKDYTDCICSGDPKCKKSRCKLKLNIDSDIEGDVYVYYELEDFISSKVAQQENFFSSRDENQLMGILDNKVSNACAPYDYDGGKPIAPCGAIADAYFNDSFSLMKKTGPVSRVFTGLIDELDKEGFRNPPLQESMTLQEAFQNFTKPKNWSKNIWEFPNGFENEQFIAWMRTDWVRKPAWKLNRSVSGYENGLKAEEYFIQINFEYPESLYNGTRKVIITNCYMSTVCGSSVFLKLLIAFSLLILVGIIVFKFCEKYCKGDEGEYYLESGVHTNPLLSIRNRLFGDKREVKEYQVKSEECDQVRTEERDHQVRTEERDQVRTEERDHKVRTEERDQVRTEKRDQVRTEEMDQVKNEGRNK